MEADPTVTLRLERDDGVGYEIVRRPDRDIVITHTADDGTVITRIRARLGLDGTFAVDTLDAEGTPAGDVEPVTWQRTSNPYGVTVERRDYGHGITAAHAFDDDARLTEVTVTGQWGTEVLELAPDGSRTLTWTTPLAGGRRRWDGADVLVDRLIRDGVPTPPA